jgi:hypothetical protein
MDPESAIFITYGAIVGMASLCVYYGSSLGLCERPVDACSRLHQVPAVPHSCVYGAHEHQGCLHVPPVCVPCCLLHSA